MAQFLGLGNGSDGNLIISANTAWNSVTGVVITGCSGDSGETGLTVDDETGFSAGQKILIIKSRGNTSATCGAWELNQIVSVSTGLLTLLIPLDNTYVDSGNDQAQVQTLPQFATATVNTGITLSASTWSGSIGGIIAFMCNGQTTITGNISASGKGFIGGLAGSSSSGARKGECGEGSVGAKARQNAANGSGGGGGISLATTDSRAGGAGGSHSTSGTVGEATGGATAGAQATTITGNTELTLMTFGGAGGGASTDSVALPGNGGNGGGIVIIYSKTLTVTGSISCNGSNGIYSNAAGGGGGSGGSVLVRSQSAVLGANLITAVEGTGGTGVDQDGGNGATGRVRIESCSITGTTNPAYPVAGLGGHAWCGSLASIIL